MYGVGNGRRTIVAGRRRRSFGFRPHGLPSRTTSSYPPTGPTPSLTLDYPTRPCLRFCVPPATVPFAASDVPALRPKAAFVARVCRWEGVGWDRAFVLLQVTSSHQGDLLVWNTAATNGTYHRRNSTCDAGSPSPTRGARAPPPAIACTRLTGAALQAHLHSCLAALPLAASCLRVCVQPRRRSSG